MTNSPSMTRRLILWLVGTTLLVWISVPTIAALTLHRVVHKRSDHMLELTALFMAPAYAAIVKRTPNFDVLYEIPHAPSFRDYLTMRFQVLNRDGKVFAYSMEDPPKPFPSAPLSEGLSSTDTDQIYTTEILPDVFLQVAQPLSVRRQAIMDDAALVFLPILVFLPFSVATCWMVIRRSLAPIEVLRQEIGARDGGNLSPMRMVDLPAELAPIAASVDRLLERLRTALDAEREFAANSAHELRTPIAGALAQAQRLVAELPQGAGKARACGIEKSLSSLGHLIEKLLQLARAGSGIGIVDRAIDLVPAVRLVVEDFGRKPEYAGRLILDVDGCATLIRKVDVEAFAIVLRNVIENALIHGLRGAPITVSVCIDGTIAIANAGPVLTHPELQEVTRRFKRGATTAAGSGLGLPIAAMLIQGMGASLVLASPARGREDGFEAIIRIPR